MLPENANAASDAAGKFAFGDILFKKAGSYKFKVSEVVPEEGIPGVSYTDKTVTITVEVTDNNNGTLTAVVDENSPELEFTNTYAVTGDAVYTPSVTKKVTGRDASADIDFEMTAADEATKNAIDDGTVTGIGGKADGYKSDLTIKADELKAGAAKTATFGALTFKKTGTYTFNITETSSAPTGWTYDAHTYTLKLVVTDNDQS